MKRTWQQEQQQQVVGTFCLGSSTAAAPGNSHSRHGQHLPISASLCFVDNSLLATHTYAHTCTYTQPGMTHTHLH